MLLSLKTLKIAALFAYLIQWKSCLDTPSCSCKSAIKFWINCFSNWKQEHKTIRYKKGFKNWDKLAKNLGGGVWSGSRPATVLTQFVVVYLCYNICCISLFTILMHTAVPDSFISTCKDILNSNVSVPMRCSNFSFKHLMGALTVYTI